METSHSGTESLTAGLPGSLVPVAQAWLERFGEEHDVRELTPEHVRLATISEFAGTTMLRQWRCYRENGADPLRQPAKAEVDAFVDSIVSGDEEIDGVKRRLREFRNRYLVSLVARQLAEPESTVATIQDWSDFASTMLAVATAYATGVIQKRFGAIRDADGEPVPFVILGMGKLGGGELNFSSDVDIVFLYARSGESDGRKSVSAETWFTRLSQQVVALIDAVTADGFVFRVDTRLRPFGDSGPPVTSFMALETYLLNHGRTWERYAYIKATPVGPAVETRTMVELFDGLIRPFVYRRYLDYGVFESLREMHAMISAEVERRDLADNLKLGPGGIREIEFVVQSLQLIRGGAQTNLQTPSLLEVLPRLADDRALSAADCDRLRDDYLLLRRLENLVQALRDQQVHDLPSDPVDQARLALAMGAPDWDAVRAEVSAARERVRRQFESIAFGGSSDGDGRFQALWQSAATEAEWQEALPGTDEASGMAARIVAFRDHPEISKIDAVASARLERLLPFVLAATLEGPEPLRTLDRVLGIVQNVLRRSAYLALLLENPEACRRVVELCCKSEYIATELARYPVLLDEMLDARVFGEGLGKDDIKGALEQRLVREDSNDIEGLVEALAHFQRATLFRVAVADFNGTLPIMKVSDALTFLAEAVLDAALAIAWRELAGRHGIPTFELDGDKYEAGFGIVAYGKLGGLELSYGSDLDIVFLNDSRGTRQETNGSKPLDNAVFFMRLARRLIHFLTTQTSSGVLYEIDMRLRPSGRKGLLVTTLDAFERYQANEAWTWEHQALLRARPVAGTSAVAKAFDAIRERTLCNAVRRDTLCTDVVEMRQKMRAELDRSTPEALDLKHGDGGLVDIEFLVQYLVLSNARDKVELIEYSDNIRQLDALAAMGVLDSETAAQLQDAYRTYRTRHHHLVLNGERPLVPPEQFARERSLVAGLWEKYLAGSVGS